ncbi:hypothetical protein HMPREF3213_03788 [Heyndrickxia coagulans]|uniref:Uncharacterized protein n=1 Tax=Heyndrickxia coagulans TaxID=1398 RepID=A0A133KAE5_HEYCO|nr:hypothetical protein HMPREF3213_03788 [Heyndrickxia coagulans]
MVRWLKRRGYRGATAFPRVTNRQDDSLIRVFFKKAFTSACFFI